MKKLVKLSIVVALSIFANFAIAQKTPEEKTKIIVTKLTQKLTLSADQQQKLRDIFFPHFNMMKDLKTQFKNSDKEEGKRAAKELWSRTDQQVIMILDDTQRAKYNEAKMKVRKNMMNRNNKKGNLKNSKNKKHVEVEVDEPLDEEAF